MINLNTTVDVQSPVSIEVESDSDIEFVPDSPSDSSVEFASITPPGETFKLKIFQLLTPIFPGRIFYRIYFGYCFLCWMNDLGSPPTEVILDSNEEEDPFNMTSEEVVLIRHAILTLVTAFRMN